MDNLNVLFLASNTAGGAGNTIFIVGMLILLLLFSYFGISRPQKKQQEKHKKMVANLKKGDRVVLIDGLHGKIDRVDDKNNTIVLDADGIYLTFASGAIRQVLPAEEAKPAAEKASEAKPEASDSKPAEEKPKADEAADTKADEAKSENADTEKQEDK
ncbi:MAG: preprotein translocase subunit YajC [Lactobacillus sp.]|nr:preprotein translocase subunit YajC [Lactobacillus sp.]